MMEGYDEGYERWSWYVWIKNGKKNAVIFYIFFDGLRIGWFLNWSDNSILVILLAWVIKKLTVALFLNQPGK